MRFAVTFDLGNFNDRFTRSATTGIFGSHWSTTRTDKFEHQTVGQVAVMRNCKHFTTRPLFIIVHIVPQLADG